MLTAQDLFNTLMDMKENGVELKNVELVVEGSSYDEEGQVEHQEFWIEECELIDNELRLS